MLLLSKQKLLYELCYFKLLYLGRYTNDITTYAMSVAKQFNVLPLYMNRNKIDFQCEIQKYL